MRTQTSTCRTRKIRYRDRTSALRALAIVDESPPIGVRTFHCPWCLGWHADHPNRAMPIIMMAATPDTKMIQLARDAGVTEFLRKPFSAEHIKLRLDGLTKAPRTFVEAKSYAGPDRRRRTVAGAARRASDKASA